MADKKNKILIKNNLFRNQTDLLVSSINTNKKIAKHTQWKSNVNINKHRMKIRLQLYLTVAVYSLEIKIMQRKFSCKNSKQKPSPFKYVPLNSETHPPEGKYVNNS